MILSFVIIKPTQQNEEHLSTQSTPVSYNDKSFTIGGLTTMCIFFYTANNVLEAKDTTKTKAIFT